MDIYYNNKPQQLSVVGVLTELIEEIWKACSEEGGLSLCSATVRPADHNKKIQDFADAARESGVMANIVLPIICKKLFGDFGQELLAISKEKIFIANDRPSALRYILLKIFEVRTGARGGGGGFFSPAGTALYI